MLSPPFGCDWVEGGVTESFVQVARYCLWLVWGKVSMGSEGISTGSRLVVFFSLDLHSLFCFILFWFNGVVFVGWVYLKWEVVLWLL